MLNIVGILALLLLVPGTALAYVGPGLGVGVIGAILGLIGMVILAVLGLFWYPIKRLFKKGQDDEKKDEDSAEDA